MTHPWDEHLIKSHSYTEEDKRKWRTGLYAANPQQVQELVSELDAVYATWWGCREILEARSERDRVDLPILLTAVEESSQRLQRVMLLEAELVKLRRERFWAFGYGSYYPMGGLYDLVGRYDTLDQAKAAVLDHENAHVVDTSTEEFFFRLREPVVGKNGKTVIFGLAFYGPVQEVWHGRTMSNLEYFT